MPKPWVVDDLRRAKLAGLVEAVVSLPTTYRVSRSAFRLRVAEVTPISTFEVLERGSRFSVLQQYLTRSVARSPVLNTITQAIRSLAKSPKPGTYVHRSTGMTSLRCRVDQEGRQGRWIVCVLPTTRRAAPVLELELQERQAFTRRSRR